MEEGTDAAYSKHTAISRICSEGTKSSQAARVLHCRSGVSAAVRHPDAGLIVYNSQSIGAWFSSVACVRTTRPR